jgi:hypothetical protein
LSRLALVALLTLSGCGLAERFACDEVSSDGIVIHSVPYKRGGTAGRAETHCGGTTDIYIWTGVLDGNLTSLIAHELWHAAGFGPHLDYPCISATPSGRSVCPREAEMMKGVKRRLWIKCSPWMRPYALEAAALWNDATGMVIFSVL